MTIQFYIKQLILGAAVLYGCNSNSQKNNSSVIEFDPSKTYQTIDNFAASDAWSCQFVGNWPDKKKNAIADLLFSTDTLNDGSPKGIGLSLWRYNIGAGSANQGEGSGIRDEWHRAASFLSDSNDAMNRIKAQNWFLSAAKQRGVNRFLGFFNSPPVNFTINKKAFATKGLSNIASNQYKQFANYAMQAINRIKNATGITFNYISPVNEPQWDWSDDKQEGCPYSNAEISKLVKALNGEIIKNNLATKIIIPESGHLKYLLKSDDKPGRDDQINSFFNTSSANYVGNLSAVKRTIASHSYFSTSPFNNAIALRKEIHQNISKIDGLQLWQTEYCILGDNEGEINGSERDLGMDAALYTAKVIYEDLVWANASAWQWWLAISPYNYKDGLIYINKNKTDGNYYVSKLLWALGNYSFFVRPGMKRIEASTTEKDLLISAFTDNGNKSVIIVVNPSDEKRTVALKKSNTGSTNGVVNIFTTDSNNHLKKSNAPINHVVIPAKAVVTVTIN
jgi:hypothetical protein